MRLAQLLGTTTVTCAVTMWGGSATAQQCEPEWDASIGQPGIESDRGDRLVNALAVFDGHVYAGGEFSRAGGRSAENIARWNGEEWSAVGGGIPELLGFGTAVYDMTVFDDGAGEALYVGGELWKAGGVEVNGIAKWDGSSWSPLGDGSGDFRALAVFDDGSGEALYGAGRFIDIGGIHHNIARWDGSEWSALGDGVGDSWDRVRALAVFDDGSGPALYAAGIFSTASGVSANRIAKWDGAQWSPLGSGLGQPAPAHAYVSSLAVFDDGSGSALYAVGGFDVAGGVAVSGIAKWSGSAWSDVGGGFRLLGGLSGASALKVFDDGSGPALYAGGAFDEAGGDTARGLARWDGSRWSSVGFSTGVGLWSVSTMTVLKTGAGADLYVGGSFSMAGGMPANCVAIFRGCATLCYADCDGSGELDFFDFLCFQNAFATMEPYADCDDSGSLDFFDFLCFQNAFAAGCP